MAWTSISRSNICAWAEFEPIDNPRHADVGSGRLCHLQVGLAPLQCIPVLSATRKCCPHISGPGDCLAVCVFNNPTMKTMFCVIALLSSVCQQANAADREWLSYNELREHTFLAKFYSVPPAQRDKVRMRAQVVPQNKAYKAADVTLTVAASDGPQIVHLDADGSFDLPENPLWVKQNPMILTSLPAGEKSGVGFSVHAVIPNGNRFSYSALMAGVVQANRLVGQLAGMLSMFAPKFDGVELHFAKPAGQTVQLLNQTGPQLFTVGSSGILKLKQDAALLKEDPLVLLSEQPVYADLSAQ